MTAGRWNPMAQAYDPPPTLAEFLLARIDEDEATIRLTTDNGRLNAVGGVIAESMGDVYSTRRLLAECEAKRRIVERWKLAPPVADDWLTPVVLDLATVYADHPDYRDEWRP